jgi:hypothetical protein
MDSDTLVENLLEDGQKLIAELLGRGFEVAAAFWLKASQNGKWDFYIVSPAVDAEGILKAYARLLSVVRTMPQPFDIDFFKIKLISPAHPIAANVVAIQGRARGIQTRPIRWSGTSLGNVSIDGAYLYSVPATIP